MKTILSLNDEHGRNFELGNGNTWMLLLSVLVGITSCEKSSPDSVVNALSDWKRSQFQPGNSRALVYFVVYGEFTNDVVISHSKYRTAGLPDGFQLSQLNREEHGSLPFTDGAFGKVVKDAALYERVQQAPECLVLHGEIVDQPNLNYLRDTIGMVTFFLDQGGFAVCDPQQFELYDTERWRQNIFTRGESNLLGHVKILVSEEPEGRWYHTRGLRKFARPDLSVRRVPHTHAQSVIDLCNRFIRMQALGARIPEEEEIRISSLPPGLICHHRGSLEDPDFNNVHVEILWPKTQ